MQSSLIAHTTRACGPHWSTDEGISDFVPRIKVERIKSWNVAVFESSGSSINHVVYGFGGRFWVSQGCRGYPFTSPVATPIFAFT